MPESQPAVVDRARSRPSTLTAYGALIAVATVWGGSVVIQKYALRSFSPVEVSVLRDVLGSMILFLVWWAKEARTVWFTRRDLGIFGALTIGVAGNHLLTLVGLQYLSGGTAGVIIGTYPVIAAFLSSLLIQDVPFRSVLPGCLISFLGVILVIGLNTGEDIGTSPWLGGILVVLAQVSWALYTIGGRRTMERFSALTVNWTTLALSIPLEVPLLWLNRKALVTGVEAVPADAWLALLYLIVFATVLGQPAWLYGVKGIGPSRAGVFVNLIPVSALILAAFILGEPIGPRKVLGVALVLAGVWLVNRHSQTAAA
jgi:drug/metabolite transporter (DMT)-like permease